MEGSNPNRKEFKFHGNLGTELAPARFAATIAYLKYDPTTLDVDILWLGDENHNRAASARLFPSPLGVVALPADDPFPQKLELLDVEGVSTGTNHSTVTAGGLRVGLSDASLGRDVRYIVTAELQPSGILTLPKIRESSYTGEVRNREIVTGKAEVTTEFGTLEACERYEHFDTVELGNQVSHAVRRASIVGSIVVPANTTLARVNSEIQHQIGDICSALSLCYRQPVGYYEIRYIPDPNNEPPLEAPWATVRLRWNSVRTKIKGDNLINMRDLISGGLQRIVSAISTSPEKDAIQRAIDFLAASYLALIEPAYFMAFSAMETVVNACIESEDKRVLGAGDWKRAERELRRSIDELKLGNHGDLMKLKLPELRRTPFLHQVQAACSRMGPQIVDLWRRQSFEDGMETAAKLRNELFHSAEAKDLGVAFANLIRIHTFTERLILRKIGWPDDRIWRWHDQNLKWANLS